MRDILVEHDPIQHPALLDLAAGDFLHTRVALDIDRLERTLVVRDGAHGLQRELAHEVRPAHDKLRSDRRLDERQHLLIVVRVDGDGDALDDLEGLLEGLVVRRDDHDRVDVAFKLCERLRKDLTSLCGLECEG